MGKLWEEIQNKASAYLFEMDERDAMNAGLVVEADEDTMDAPAEEPVDEEPVDEEPMDEEPVDEEPVDEEPIDEEPMDEEPIDDGESAAGAIEDVPDEDISTKDVAKAVKTLSGFLAKSEKKINTINFNKLSFAKQNEVLDALRNVHAKAKDLASEIDSFNKLSWK